MNETLTLSSSCADSTSGSAVAAVPGSADVPEPTERLEARICELAGHLTAATCQFLLLVVDFDERKGWAAWEMPSCAAWLSWKCQVAPGTAREQVRVARGLVDYPLIRQEFAAGRLSYAKARALTRIVTPGTDADLVAMATPMTAGQLERFAQAHRRVSETDRARPRPARKLTWGPVGELDYQFRAILPAEAAAVVFQALRAARNDLEHPHDDHDHDGGEGRDVSAETRAARLSRLDAEAGTNFTGEQPPPAEMEPTENLADALVQVCADYLAARAATADNPDTYQVIIHAGVRAITGTEPAAASEPAGVSAETPDPRPQAPEPAPPDLPFWHPAHEDRCHLDDGPAITPATLALIGCTATTSTMFHNLSGAIIDVAPAATGFAFYTKDGTLIPGCPQLPQSPGDITTTHDAAITPATINPPHSGERLNLSLAIWIAFVNARTQTTRREATHEVDFAEGQWAEARLKKFRIAALESPATGTFLCRDEAGHWGPKAAAACRQRERRDRIRAARRARGVRRGDPGGREDRGEGDHEPGQRHPAGVAKREADADTKAGTDADPKADRAEAVRPPGRPRQRRHAPADQRPPADRGHGLQQRRP
ncbi:MAG: hypothetical protein ACRDOI_28575 [Trebonia sp.]